MLTRILALLTFFSILTNCQSQTPSNIQIIPQPRSVKTQTGSFTLSADTRVYYPEGEKDWQTVSDYWIALVQSGAGLNLIAQSTKEKLNKPRTNSIYMLVDESIPEKEGYVLDVKPAAIVIRAKTAAGAFYAVQTLRQLFPPELNTRPLPAKMKSKGGDKPAGLKWTAPGCLVQDAPRFQYRGLHLDVSRHFFTVDFIKRYIDLLAVHKLNVFHWHLTDDQGWRIEIKKYPKLQTIASCRKETLVGHYTDRPVKYDGKKYCGYYTQEEVKDVLEYARKQFVTVIPEIEMPGHALAALSAYPELGCSGGPYEAATKWGVFEDVFCPTEKTFEFIDDVLAEVCALFPSEYVHVGGDECPKTSWQKSDFCQQLMKQQGLKDEHELQSYFIRRAEAMLNKRGKKLIGWDEILEGGLAASATVMSWRGVEGGIAAAKAGHDAIMTPTDFCYFDYYQGDPATEPVAIGGYLPLETVYSYEPVPNEFTAEEAKHILGTQANLWTEYITEPAQVEYMMYPRACALAEIAWSAKEKKNWKDFSKRIKAHFGRLSAMGVNYAKTFYDVTASFSKGKITLTTLDAGSQIRFTTNGKDPSPKAKMYSAPISVSETTVIKAAVFQGDQQLGNVREVEFMMHKASGKPYKMTKTPDKYTGGEANALTNGVPGGLKSWSNWVGLVNTEIDPVIDLGTTTSFGRITTHYLLNNAARIYPPRTIEVFGSNDGKNFTSLAKQVVDVDKKMDSMGIETVKFDTKKAKYRYIKLVATPFGIIPKGFRGEGEGSWLFLDEVMVE